MILNECRKWLPFRFSHKHWNRRSYLGEASTYQLKSEDRDQRSFDRSCEVFPRHGPFRLLIESRDRIITWRRAGQNSCKPGQLFTGVAHLCGVLLLTVSVSREYCAHKVVPLSNKMYCSVSSITDRQYLYNLPLHISLQSYNGQMQHCCGNFGGM